MPTVPSAAPSAYISAAMKQNATLGQTLRYRFDNLMARGAGPQMLLLGGITLVAIVVTAAVLALAGLAPAVGDDGTTEGFGQLVWRGLMRTMDSGAVGGDTGSWSFLIIMLAITLVGIFVLSALIGILNGALEGALENLRKGKSRVVESGHTVVLGYTPKVHTLLGELAEAARNQKDACVVVLADRDKVEMDDEIAFHLGDRAKLLRVVTRSGSPHDLADLSIVNIPAARAVVVPSPEGSPGESMTPNEADTVVLKTLLALSKVPGARAVHLVAELQEEKTLGVARMVVAESAALVLSPPLISRLLVQTGRQSGLSAVYLDLLNFEGEEIYVQPVAALTGKTFHEALHAFDDSALMGVISAKGELLLPPAFDRKFAASDLAVVISADDDTVKANGTKPTIDATALVEATARPSRQVERTLVLGASDRVELVLRELDAYVAPGSETLVVGESDERWARAERRLGSLVNMKVRWRSGDVTDRDTLDALDVPGFDQALVLAETGKRTPNMADARTLVSLLHLRDIARRSGKRTPVTTEMLDAANQELANVAEADDFIVSDMLVSLLMAQVSENPHLYRIFNELFRPEGHEIYLKPASTYVRADAEVAYGQIVEVAARLGHVALGYRQGTTVALNPKKSGRVKLGASDTVIVMAAD